MDQGKRVEHTRSHKRGFTTRESWVGPDDGKEYTVVRWDGHTSEFAPTRPILVTNLRVIEEN